MILFVSLRFTDVKEKVFECHILNKFDEDFYGFELAVAVCAYLRDELKFTTLDALIEAITDDCKRTELVLASKPRYLDVSKQLESL